MAQAILTYQADGTHYLVTTIGAQAGKILGEEQVAVSTVRMWHADYVSTFNSKEGLFRADERGHHSRDLLIMEEDVKHKFVKWSLLKAKTDDLCIEAARDFLNNELLNTLEAFENCLMPLPTLPCLIFWSHKLNVCSP